MSVMLICVISIEGFADCNHLFLLYMYIIYRSYTHLLYPYNENFPENLGASSFLK